MFPIVLILVLLVGGVYAYSYTYTFTDDDLPDEWEKKTDELIARGCTGFCYADEVINLTTKRWDAPFREYLRQPEKLRKKSLQGAYDEGGYQSSFIYNRAIEKMFDKAKIEYRREYRTCGFQTPHSYLVIKGSGGKDIPIDAWAVEHGCRVGQTTSLLCNPPNDCQGPPLEHEG